jgi:hypothetical protein
MVNGTDSSSERNRQALRPKHDLRFVNAVLSPSCIWYSGLGAKAGAHGR